jgi:hypothetical protein
MSLHPSHYRQSEALCRFWKPKAPIVALLTHVLTTPGTQAIEGQLLDTRGSHQSHAGLDPTRGSAGLIWSTEQGQAYENRFLENPDEWLDLGNELGDVFEIQEKGVPPMISRNYKSRVMDLQIALAHKYNMIRCGKGKDIGCENILLPPLNNVSQFKRRG